MFHKSVIHRCLTYIIICCILRSTDIKVWYIFCTKLQTISVIKLNIMNKLNYYSNFNVIFCSIVYAIEKCITVTTDYLDSYLDLNLDFFSTV